MFRIVWFLVVLCGFAVMVCAPANAATSKEITKDMVDQGYQAMALLLNDRMARQEAMTYMHHLISADAQFEMSAANPTLPETVAQDHMSLSKADYINSFIQGPNLIDQYSIQIKTVGVEVSEDGQSAVAKTIITESGTPVSPVDFKPMGPGFISVTNCETSHTLEQGKLVVTGGKCHTVTNFQNMI